MKISDETREKQRAAKLGRTYTAEHRAAISRGLRAAYTSGSRVKRGLKDIPADKLADYRFLVYRKRLRRAEALAALGISS